MTARLTDQQRAAAHAPGEGLCVDAGAGSGKTTVLVERIMHLLDCGVDLRRIVAITFTRKAAAEMKERLREAIHRRPENDPRSMDKWRALELEIETARVTTIDGFCASLLHENALRTGLDPDFSTLADEEAPLLRAAIAETTLAALLDRGAGGARRLVVEHGLERLTAFLEETLNQTARFEEAARPYAGLDADGLTTLWQTQAEDLQRVRDEELAASPEAARLAATLGGFAGQCTDPEDKTEVHRREALRFLHMMMERGNTASVRAGVQGACGLKLIGGSKKAWSSEEAMRAVKAAVKEARELALEYCEPEYDPGIEKAAAVLTLDAIEVFGEVAAAYREAKQSREALDFADLLKLTAEMLHGQPDTRARIAGGIEHLLIDEFQDTNHAQLLLVTLLSADNGAEVFVVGDAKQSVYRFRGAEVEVFTEAKLRIGKTRHLDENFRSVPSLIAFINDFFRESGLLARVETEFHRLTAKREGPAETCIEFLIPPEEEAEENAEDEGRDEPSEPRLGEAELIAGRIAEICGPQGVKVYDKECGEWRPAQFGDVAILYRAATHASIYEESLRRRGIRSSVVAGSGFYARQEILDLCNLFSAALDPWNEPALAAFLRGPLAGVTDDTLMRMTRNSTLARDFWSGADKGDRGENEILRRARALLEFIRARREWPVAALVRALLAETGFEAVLLAQYHGAQKAGNVHKLADIARGFGGAGRAGLHAFTEHLSSLARNGLRAGDAELLAEHGGTVTLMTVHKAKGLEFPIVVVADMGRAPGGGENSSMCMTDPRRGLVVATHTDRGETAWPMLGEHLRRHDREDVLAEESRLLYVAMTRARDRLLLAGAAKPKSKSWMSALKKTYGLEDPEHDAPVRGATWAARVVRRASATAVTAPKTVVASVLSVDALIGQTAPLAPRTRQSQVIPVRALLDLMYPVPAGSPGAATRAGGLLDRRILGTAAHALLERWDFSGEPPSVELAREFFPAPQLFEACVQELGAIVKRLQASELWPRLTAAKDLRRELPFLFEIHGVFLNGVMDAWIDGDMLVDYKLGTISLERSARHEAQLHLYAAAVRAATLRAPEDAYLYYLGSGELVRVEVGGPILDGVIAQAGAALGLRIPATAGPVRGEGV
jgi:ATP-dependent helicase/nuclease subunit A